jgi:hypothetical protein
MVNEGHLIALRVPLDVSVTGGMHSWED